MKKKLSEFVFKSNLNRFVAWVLSYILCFGAVILLFCPINFISTGRMTEQEKLLEIRKLELERKIEKQHQLSSDGKSDSQERIEGNVDQKIGNDKSVPSVKVSYRRMEVWELLLTCMGYALFALPGAIFIYGKEMKRIWQANSFIVVAGVLFFVSVFFGLVYGGVIIGIELPERIYIDNK